MAQSSASLEVKIAFFKEVRDAQTNKRLTIEQSFHHSCQLFGVDLEAAVAWVTSSDSGPLDAMGIEIVQRWHHTEREGMSQDEAKIAFTSLLEQQQAEAAWRRMCVICAREEDTDDDDEKCR